MNKTFQEWESELDQVLANIRTSYMELGKVLYDAKFSDLNSIEYDKLLDYAERWGHSRADTRAAVAAYRSKIVGQQDEAKIKADNRIFKSRPIDPDLVFAGAKNSKILFMDEPNQKKLLFQKFPVITPTGKEDDPKNWMEMSDFQRNILLDKGGRILTVKQQLKKLHGKDGLTVYALDSVGGVNDELMLTGANNTMHLSIPFTDFAQMLQDAGYWDSLIAAGEAIREAQQENVEQLVTQ